MGLEETLKTEVATIFSDVWQTRDGQKVPEPSDLKLGSNDAVKLEATILYADIAESTKLVDGYKWWFAGEVYKAYLHCCGKIIKSQDGVIVSYDGDRVMAVFIGDKKNTRAVKAALMINAARRNVINPGIKDYYKERSNFQLKQAVGIDTSTIYAARTGVRNDNDIVWIGKAANHAAKLCDLRDEYYSTWISPAIYANIDDKAKLSSTGEDMWTAHILPDYTTVYKSSYYWTNF